MKCDNIYNELFGNNSKLYNDNFGKTSESILGVDMEIIQKEMKRQKCPKSIVDFKKEYNELYHTFRKEILFIVNKLNRASIKDRKLKYNINIFDGKLKSDETKLYFKDSYLWSGSYHNLPIQSKAFKARFICSLLCEIYKNLDVMIETQFRYSGRKMLEHEDRYFILYEIYATVNDFISNYISDEYGYKDFIRLNKILGCHSHIKRRKKFVKKLKDILPSLESDSNKLLLSGEEEYRLINDLMNVAYMIATDIHNIKERRPITDKIRFNSNYGMELLIEELGEDIFVNGLVDGFDPIIYKAFFNAKPQVFTRHQDAITNKFLNTGIKSLYYLSFIYNDKHIRKYIKKMIN